MTVKVRLTRELLVQIRNDLARTHAFAAERIGFAYGRWVVAGEGERLLLLSGYEPVADEHYLYDPRAGARIDGRAIRGAMQGVLDRGEGAVHVHMHDWPGRPVLSRMDAEEIPQVVTGLRRAGPTYAHGILLLHQVECAAWIWPPGEEEAEKAESVSVVGFPLEIFGGTTGD
jgi:hypothetical protein